jgi:hypothetical protein
MIQTSDSSRIYVGNNSTTTPHPVPFYFQHDETWLSWFVIPLAWKFRS